MGQRKEEEGERGERREVRGREEEEENRQGGEKGRGEKWGGGKEGDWSDNYKQKFFVTHTKKIGCAFVLSSHLHWAFRSSVNGIIQIVQQRGDVTSHLPQVDTGGEPMVIRTCTERLKV